MMYARHRGTWLATMIMLASIASQARAGDPTSEWKTVHVKNPFPGAAATDMHIVFKEGIVTITTTPPHLDSNGQPFQNQSNTFGTATAQTTSSNTGDFTNPNNGGLASGSTDDFNVRLSGPLVTTDPAMWVSSVTFTPSGNMLSKALDPVSFASNVTGFTNDESFNLFANSNSTYTVSDDPGSHTSYTLTNFALFTGMPAGQFDSSSQWFNSSTGTMVFSAPILTLNPGDSMTFNLGAVPSTTYALASITSVSATDLDTGTTNTFTVPQYHAGMIPEPTSFLLLGSGLALLFAGIGCRNLCAWSFRTASGRE